MPPVKKQDITYVISVSFDTGCYRHIKISGTATLFKLHKAILDAFGFDDDHAHAFFLNNIAWDNSESYYADFIDEVERHTSKYKLSNVLYKDMKFKYIFDFGDEWLFQCRVLKALEEKCGKPEVIKSVGKAPEQYPDYEDEEKYDEEDYDDQKDADEIDEMTQKILSLMTPDEAEFITKFVDDKRSFEDIDLDTLFSEFVQSTNEKYALEGKPVHSLKAALWLFNISELRKIAKNWGIVGVSKLKKEQLISEIFKAASNTEIIENYLLAIPEDEWSFLINAAKADTYKDEKIIYCNMITLKSLVFVLLFQNDGEFVFVVPDEIKDVLRKLDKNGFIKKKFFNDSLNRYAAAAVNLYGAIELDEFIKLYNNYTDGSIDKDTVITALNPYILQQGQYMFRRNYIISIEFDEIFEEIEELEQMRKGKPMYVPKKDEFLCYAQFNYYEETPQTKKVLNLLKKAVDDDVIVENMVSELHYYIVSEESFQDILGNFEDIFADLTKSEVKAIIAAITDMINNTRIWSNYGHTPIEIRNMFISNNK